MAKKKKTDDQDSEQELYSVPADLTSEDEQKETKEKSQPVSKGPTVTKLGDGTKKVDY